MAAKCAWYLHLAGAIVAVYFQPIPPPPPAPSTPPRRWARPQTTLLEARLPSPSATKTTTGKKQTPSSSDTPPRKTASLTDQQLQDRWTKVKEGALSGKHTKVELLCQACLTTNWQTKERCRGCGAPTASSWTILPSQWPPVGVPGTLLSKWDMAEKDNAKGDSAESMKHSLPAASPDPCFSVWRSAYSAQCTSFDCGSVFCCRESVEAQRHWSQRPSESHGLPTQERDSKVGEDDCRSRWFSYCNLLQTCIGEYSSATSGRTQESPGNWGQTRCCGGASSRPQASKRVGPTSCCTSCCHSCCRKALPRTGKGGCRRANR